MENPDLDPRYWDSIVENQRSSLRVDCWRKYMKNVYSRLMHTWFPLPSGRTLKTDLFEEAFTSHSLLPEMTRGSVGLDYSIRIAIAAKRRVQNELSNFHLLVCDLRHLPFRTNCMEQVLSPSSLDHFRTKTEIDDAIRELSRILKPGGVLILAMDNPQNPVVWIRNHLPFTWLNRIGIVPYYVGPTCTIKEATEKLRAAGMKVTDQAAVAHVPRLPAIWLSMIAQAARSKLLGEWLSRTFDWWEFLAKWPLRFQTAYYIALRAEKCRS